MSWEDIIKANWPNPDFDAEKRKRLKPGADNLFGQIMFKLMHRFEEGNPMRNFSLGMLMRQEQAFEKTTTIEEWNSECDKFALFLMTNLNDEFDSLMQVQSGRPKAEEYLRIKGFYMDTGYE